MFRLDMRALSKRSWNVVNSRHAVHRSTAAEYGEVLIYDLSLK